MGTKTIWETEREPGRETSRKTATKTVQVLAQGLAGPPKRKVEKICYRPGGYWIFQDESTGYYSGVQVSGAEKLRLQALLRLLNAALALQKPSDPPDGTETAQAAPFIWSEKINETERDWFLYPLPPRLLPRFRQQSSSVNQVPGADAPGWELNSEPASAENEQPAIEELNKPVETGGGSEKERGTDPSSWEEIIKTIPPPENPLYIQGKNPMGEERSDNIDNPFSPEEYEAILAELRRANFSKPSQSFRKNSSGVREERGRSHQNRNRQKTLLLSLVVLALALGGGMLLYEPQNPYEEIMYEQGI